MNYRKFKELDDRNSYSNEYGTNAYISSYVHYMGTEQVSIYIKTGYGAGEETFNVIISEHEISEWKIKFMNNPKVSENNLTNQSYIKTETIKEVKTKNEVMEDNKSDKVVVEFDKKDNFDSMRNLLFESMRIINSSLNQSYPSCQIQQLPYLIYYLP